MFKKMTVTALVALMPMMAFADGHMAGDADKGAKVFRKCKACHAVGEGAKNKSGPVLNGIVGRQIAAGEDFRYSGALVELGAEGKSWTVEELDAFLTKPKAYAKGTKMAFAGLRKDADRANLIAYLATFPDGGS